MAQELEQAERAFADGDLSRGERLVRRALARAPDSARANELMAYALIQRGDEERALAHLRKATRQKAASAAASHQLGSLLRKRGHSDEARAAYVDAIRRDEDFFPAHHDLGTLLHDLGLFPAALAALDHAAALAPHSFEVHHNRGRTLHALRRHEEAIENYERALAIRPDSPPTLLNRGEAMADLRRYDDALRDYQRALELEPGFDDARWNESLTRLLLGDFETGWKLYECRWSGSLAWPRRHHDLPSFLDAADVKGKRVLVWSEQGLGDSVHFCRYLPMLAARGAHVVFEVQAPLVRLMRSLARDIEVIGPGEDPGPCDFQVPLLSLPLAFGTTAATIPGHVPYLAADRSQVVEWGRQLGGGVKIGIACSGHARQKDDQARSMPLHALAPLAQHAELFVVQVEVRPEDRAFAAEPGSRIHLLDNRIRDFADSAAIIENMTALVTIDTAVAHLAGALAKPTWIMLPWTPTWRWMVDREDSPWYPTARLVRQTDSRRWDDVVQRVLEQLFP